MKHLKMVRCVLCVYVWVRGGRVMVLVLVLVAVVLKKRVKVTEMGEQWIHIE